MRHATCLMGHDVSCEDRLSVFFGAAGALAAMTAGRPDVYGGGDKALSASIGLVLPKLLPKQCLQSLHVGFGRPGTPTGQL